MENLNTGLDEQAETVNENIGNEFFDGYYSGEVIYRDFESNAIRTITQMDFVKMLIGINTEAEERTQRF
ncbi:MAG: hypothetical protein IJ697_06590 [Synergistaceae bacterium]|nr:hypothetical protein [Synergistaceae bacterium]